MATDAYAPCCPCGTSLDRLSTLPGGVTYEAGSGRTETADTYRCDCGREWSGEDVDLAYELLEPLPPTMCLHEARNSGARACRSVREQAVNGARLHGATAANWARRYREQVPA